MRTADEIRQSLLDLQYDLTNHFAGMGEVAQVLTIGAVAGQHVCLLGEPGVAKTKIVNRFSAGISGRYWYRNVDESTMPTSLFGGLNMAKAMATGEEEHMTAGHFPDAHIVLLDEAFRCNSMSLNALLPVLNERIFVNNGQPMQLPLQLCVAASNSYPRKGMEALWDRFPLRFWVDDVKGDAEFAKLWELQESEQRVLLTVEELGVARNEAGKVQLGQGMGDVATAVSKIILELAPKGIRVSGRRVKVTQRILQAYAWLQGDTEVTAEHLDLLQHLFWDRHAQQPDVEEAVEKHQDQTSNEVKKISEALHKV
jgi:MoxR-like ATPase